MNTYLCRYMVKSQDDRRLVSLSLQQFVRSVGARTAAPGGGSVSAAIAAMVGKCFHGSSGISRQVLDASSVIQGAALGAMVGQMTYGKRQFENLDGVMRRLIPPFHQAMNELLLMVDADSSAFNSYMVRKDLSRVVFWSYCPAPISVSASLFVFFCCRQL